MFKRQFVSGFAVLVCASAASSGAVLYSQNFDVDDTANWTVNNNNLGTNAANVFYDYSAASIPSAPNSTGNTTIGLKIGANLNSANAPASGIPGISVSPTGQSFSGDYTLSFDWWSNYIGPLNVGAAGSTMLSNYGIMSSGTAANYPGSADGVWFSATGDGQSSTDYRIYSSERQSSYDIPASGNPLDLHATYAAGSRNSSAALYTATFPAGAQAPAEQLADYPSQSSSTSAGAAGFRWHEVDITKLGDTVTWRVNGTLLASLDTSSFTTSGSNILFGHSDTNSTTNTNAQLLQDLQFTLIDNVVVSEAAVPEPAAMSLLAVGAVAALRRRRRDQ